MMIGYDYDHVVADRRRQMAFFANELYGVKAQPHLFTRQYAVSENRLLTSRQYNRLKTHIYWHGHGIDQLRPMPNAIKYIKELQMLGHRDVIISSCSKRASKFAQRWCDQRQLKTKVVGVGKNNPDKSKIARQFHLNAFVDNDLHKLELLRDFVPHLYWFAPTKQEREHAGEWVIPVDDWNMLFQQLIALT